MKNEAKREMLKSLRKIMMMDDDMGLGQHMKGKKQEKVIVSADNPKDLEKGLDKAKEILAKRSEMFGLDEDEECETPSEEIDEDEEELKKLKRAE